MSAGLPDLAHALGWAIMHFLWQGLVIGLAVAGALRVVGRDAPIARYWIGCLGMLASLVAFCATATLGAPERDAMEVIDSLAPLVTMPAQEIVAAVAELPETESDPIGFVGPVSLLWALGVVLMSVRIARGGLWVRRLHRDGRSLEGSSSRLEEAQRTALELARAMGVRRRVRVLTSAIVESPLVVGWLRPVILVPAATWTALTAAELRAVLAHELAHIRRHDPLVNAVQALVEALLFFHPVVWWLSSVVRDERELCCDLVAIEACRDARALATGLTRLESLRLSYSQVALAAKTPRGSLMTRIQRILDHGDGAHFPRRARRASAPRTLLLAAFGAVTLGLGVGNAAALPAAVEPGAATLSLEGRDAEADYAVVEARVLQAVAAGELKPNVAKETLRALRRTMFSGSAPVSARTVPGRRVEYVTGVPIVTGTHSSRRVLVEGQPYSVESVKTVEGHPLPVEVREQPIAVGVPIVEGRRLPALVETIQEQPVAVGVEVVEGQPLPTLVEEYYAPSRSRKDRSLKDLEAARAQLQMLERNLEASRRAAGKAQDMHERERVRFEGYLRNVERAKAVEGRLRELEGRLNDQAPSGVEATVEGRFVDLTLPKEAVIVEGHPLAAKEMARVKEEYRRAAELVDVTEQPPTTVQDLAVGILRKKGKDATKEVEVVEGQLISTENALNVTQQRLMDLEAQKAAVEAQLKSLQREVKDVRNQKRRR